MAVKGLIVVREDDLGIDEVIAEGAHVHLERMSDGCLSLIVETSKERAAYTISRKRGSATISTTEVFRDAKKRGRRQ